MGEEKEENYGRKYGVEEKFWHGILDGRLSRSSNGWTYRNLLCISIQTILLDTYDDVDFRVLIRVLHGNWCDYENRNVSQKFDAIQINPLATI